jgi:hypothetical protein
MPLPGSWYQYRQSIRVSTGHPARRLRRGAALGGPAATGEVVLENEMSNN